MQDCYNSLFSEIYFKKYFDWREFCFICTFLYCNHQVHRDFLITLYKLRLNVNGDVFLFSAAQQPTSDLAAFLFRLLRHTHLDTHTPGRTSLNEESIFRRGRYLHKTQQTQETRINDL
jgi:hypothetical protein